MIPESGRSAQEGIGYPLLYSWASLKAQLVKNLPAMQETWVQSLGWEDPLEEGMRTYSSRFWRILENSMDRGSLAGYSAWGHKELDVTKQLSFHFHTLQRTL